MTRRNPSATTSHFDDNNVSLWCPACDDDETTTNHHNHRSRNVCTICGAALQPRRVPPRTTTNPPDSASAAFTSPRRNGNMGHSVNGDLEEYMQQGLMRAITTVAQSLSNTDTTTTSATTASNATSAAYLQSLPRRVLHPNSALLIRATVTWGTTGTNHNGKNDHNDNVSGGSCSAIPGDFNVQHHPLHPMPVHFHDDSSSSSSSSVIICGPVVECGTQMRIRTRVVTAASSLMTRHHHTNAMIALFDRGDISFVRKGLLAQEAGAVAAIVANHVSHPWPYQMRDNTNTNTATGSTNKNTTGSASSSSLLSSSLTIPVVMIRKEDAVRLRLWLQKNDDPQSSSSSSSSSSVVQQSSPVTIQLQRRTPPPECCICLQPLEARQTILQLRRCQHVFHEACALQWLQTHASCPYCRDALPIDTDDSSTTVDHVSRRNRSSNNNNNAEMNSLYW